MYIRNALDKTRKLWVMSIPKEFLKEANAMPAPLRDLLETELAAENQIVEVGHSFPAPPNGAYFRLARAVVTRRHESGEGLEFYERDTPYYPGEFTDTRRFFFILEPPHPQPPEPYMDAIRSTHRQTPSVSNATRRLRTQTQSYQDHAIASDSPLRRFERSMVIDYERWHDGVGYDLEALHQATLVEREAMEKILIHRNPLDWRDIEALAALDTPAAREVLKTAVSDSNPEVRMAMARYAPKLVTNEERTAYIVQALRTAKLFGGLSQALDQVAEFHPPEVVSELFQGVLEREGEVAVLFAAMLVFVYGKADDPFDMELRPFFLRFNTDVTAERRKAFRKLCRIIGADPKKHPQSKKHFVH